MIGVPVFAPAAPGRICAMSAAPSPTTAPPTSRSTSATIAPIIMRYLLAVCDELPKTPTAKVAKHLLRERGNTTSTWDRDAAGMTITLAGLAEEDAMR